MVLNFPRFECDERMINKYCLSCMDYDMSDRFESESESQLDPYPSYRTMYVVRHIYVLLNY